MVRKPSVFLMDEPLSNLDAKLREHMRVELVRLHQKLGTTSIYVTHDQTEAMTMATKIVLMNDGRIQQAGKPDEFYNRPANIFVAKFIGSPTMNIIEGTIVKGHFISNDELIQIKPTPDDEKLLKDYEGKKVSVGIRPERFESGGKFGDTFEATIDVVEMLGKEKILYARLENDKELVISTPGHYEYVTGEKHSFGFDIGAIHFFDSETEERIN
jgi:multiple sugar transport system ATP-binding protein